ncbi:MAG: hypothetical protein ACLR6J_12250 [Parabacteroides merdae]
MSKAALAGAASTVEMKANFGRACNMIIACLLVLTAVLNFGVVKV